MENLTNLWMLKIIAIIGLLNTLYLIYHKVKGTNVLCLGFPEEWCKKVTQSPQSKTFGIPNPYLGFAMLAAILVLLRFYEIDALPFWPAFLLITFGFLFSIYFIYVQAVKIKAFCTWCVLSAVVFLFLFLFSLLEMGLL